MTNTQSITTPQIIRVIGIDASTRDTGIVCLEVDLANHRSVTGVTARHYMRMIGIGSEKTITARFDRLRTARKEMALFLASLPEIHLVGYEDPFMQGKDATCALHQAIGMFLGLGKFDDLPIYDVATSTVKKEHGTAGLSASSVDKTIRGAKDAKKRQLKQLGIDWANRRITFPLGPLTDQDAISDACGVAMAAFHKWQDEQYLKEQAASGQGRLTLRRAPVRRTTTATK